MLYYEDTYMDVGKRLNMVIVYDRSPLPWGREDRRMLDLYRESVSPASF